MRKEVIKYTDFDGNEKEEVAYFHLNKAEQIRIAAQAGEDTFEDYIQKIIERRDPDEILDLIDYILKTAYGIRDEEGRFLKPKAEQEAFIASEAYGELFEELLTDEKRLNALFGNLINEGKQASIPESVTKATKRKTAKSSK